MTDELIKVGELARRAGVSVRTLHHYDALGLVRPSFTTAAGHRQYTAADALRLSHVRALQALGFALEEVRALLEDPRSSPVDALTLLGDRARERAEEARALADRLDHLAGALRARRTPDLDDLLETLHEMERFDSLFETYYTPDQLAALARRRDELGEDALRGAQDAWSQLYADAAAAAEAGLDPAGPEGRALAARKRELIAAFTGGDPGIEAALRRMYAENPDLRQAVAGEPAAMEFLRRAEEA